MKFELWLVMFTRSFKDKEHWNKWYPDSSPTDIFPAGFSPTDSCPRAFTRRTVSQRTVSRGIVPRTDISFDNFSCCQKYIFAIKIFNRFSKVFDCIIHDLLPADISACGFHYSALGVIDGFLGGGKFTAGIGSSCSPIHVLFMGVHQWSIQGPFSFVSTYKCEIFSYAIVNLT